MTSSTTAEVCTDANCYRCLYPYGTHCSCCQPTCEGND